MGWTQPDLAINTNFIRHNHKVYCAYCGKEIEKDSEWDDYEETEWYHCNCTDALKEIELTKRIKELNKEKKQTC